MTKKIIQRVIIVIFAILLVLAATVTIMYFHRSSPDDVIKYDTTNPFIVSDTQIAAHRSGAEFCQETS